MKKFEGSKKDEREDKRLARKYGMSMNEWEKSAADKKHDTQRSAKGLKRGGPTTADRKNMGRNQSRIANQRGK